MKYIMMVLLFYTLMIGNTSMIFADELTNAGGISFEIQGTITEIRENSVSVWGETFILPKELQKILNTDKTIKIGNIVNVKGRVIDNELVAGSIEKVGENPAMDLALSEPVHPKELTKSDNNLKSLQEFLESIKVFIAKLGQ